MRTMSPAHTRFIERSPAPFPAARCTRGRRRARRRGPLQEHGPEATGRVGRCNRPLGMKWRALRASENQHVREDLPCEEALRDEAQPQIPAFAVAVLAPAPDALVLQRLVDREAVEEDEEGHEDR